MHQHQLLEHKCGFCGLERVTGSVCYVLTSTNLALPKNQWLPVATNVLTVQRKLQPYRTNAANAGISRQTILYSPDTIIHT